MYGTAWTEVRATYMKNILEHGKYGKEGSGQVFGIYTGDRWSEGCQKARREKKKRSAREVSLRTSTVINRGFIKGTGAVISPSVLVGV